MRLLRTLPILLGLAGACAAGPALPGAGGPYRNLFQELLGKSDAEVDARIAGVWQQFFHGEPETQRLYYPVGGDMAYVPDVANRDARTEGLSYGMMICVQLDHRREFDAIWKWAKVHLYHADGPIRGYFAWHGDFKGRPLDQGPAPDGEEWFVTALFFASHRWGSGGGIFNYEKEAQELLHTMIHKDEESGHDGTTSMFDPGSKEIVFVPEGPGAHFTDPSYHLPHFYELWARWAADPADRKFCAEAAAVSRSLFKLCANPVTGLMPDYCGFDGKPVDRHGHGDFRYDAWRTLCYPAMDYSWFNPDPWYVERGNRVLRFLASQGPNCPDRFTLGGKPISADVNEAGLSAMAATAGLAADPSVARPFVKTLWELETPSGHFRYYNGLLTLLALMEAGGRFRIYPPAAHP
jgi:oligosaccharide reducing-end xylanase